MLLIDGRAERVSPAVIQCRGVPVNDESMTEEAKKPETRYARPTPPRHVSTLPMTL